MPISHSNRSEFKIKNQNFVLIDMWNVPTASKNLLSVHKLCTDNSVLVEFDAESVTIGNQETKEELMKGNSNGGLYQLPVQIDKTNGKRW